MTSQPEETVDNLFDIRDRVIVVTGAARGLGQAIANCLARRGARLALYDRDAGELATTSGRLADTFTRAVDITDEAALASAVAETKTRFGRIDGAVNAAGVLTIGAARELDAAAFRRCIDVNLTGAFLFSRIVAGAMDESGGRIVHLASVSSRVANLNYAAYASSKAALSQLVRVLAREWASRNILVNAIGPAVTETAMTREHLDDPTYRDGALSVIPMARFGTPEDLFGVVVLLLAPGGGFITGQTIYVDGGRTLV